MSVRQLWEDFAQYLYLPRLRDADVLLACVQAGAAELAWEQETFAYADSYDPETQRYHGLRAGQHTSVRLEGLVVKPEAARRQFEAEQREREAQLAVGGVAAGTAGAAAPNAWISSGAPIGTPAAPPAAATVGEGGIRTPAFHRFHGSVAVDAKRLSRDVGLIADEVLQHLVKHAELQRGSVRVTLEIEAQLPEGAPDDLVRTVNENCRTLKFADGSGFEEE